MFAQNECFPQTFEHSEIQHGVIMEKKMKGTKNRIQRSINFDQKHTIQAHFPLAYRTTQQRRRQQKQWQTELVYALQRCFVFIVHIQAYSITRLRLYSTTNGRAQTRHRRKFISRMFPMIRSLCAIAVLH